MSAPRELVIIGGGEHARVVAEAARSRPEQWALRGFVDERQCADTIERLGLERLGGDDEAMARIGSAAFVLGMGGIDSIALRRRIVARFDAAGASWASVVHASAWVSPSATVGEGAVVGACAVVNTGAHVGAHSIVNTGAIVEHDVGLGDFAIVTPGVVVGGAAEIGEDCYLGLGCRVRDHIRVGRGCVVGMGAVVVAPLADGTRAWGVPARDMS